MICLYYEDSEIQNNTGEKGWNKNNYDKNKFNIAKTWLATFQARRIQNNDEPSLHWPSLWTIPKF